MELEEMNIYLLKHDGEFHWICAPTSIIALQHYIEQESLDINRDFSQDDDIKLLPKEEWSKRSIKYTDPEEFEIPFDEYMKTALSIEIFASTTYEQ